MIKHIIDGQEWVEAKIFAIKQNIVTRHPEIYKDENGKLSIPTEKITLSLVVPGVPIVVGMPYFNMAVYNDYINKRPTFGKFAELCEYEYEANSCNDPNLEPCYAFISTNDTTFSNMNTCSLPTSLFQTYIDSKCTLRTVLIQVTETYKGLIYPQCNISGVLQINYNYCEMCNSVIHGKHTRFQMCYSCAKEHYN